MTYFGEMERNAREVDSQMAREEKESKILEEFRIKNTYVKSRVTDLIAECMIECLGELKETQENIRAQYADKIVLLVRGIS